MASTYLTIDSQAGNTSTWTWSGWVKRGELSTSQVLFGAGTVSNSFIYVRFRVEDTLQLYQELGGTTSIDLQTSQVFRDTSAWYHIVVAFDDTQATASDRVKFYVNGSQITSFGTSTYPGQNDTTYFNNSTNRPFHLGARSFDQTNIYDGSMAHVHWIDGTQYQASDFGETDATTGIWKPKTAPSVTYGTNGFFLKFENSGAFGTDSSGNSNNFTVNGTMTQTIDTPSNVFATLNPLTVIGSEPSLSLGNLKYNTGVAFWRTVDCSHGFSQGKYYWEIKIGGTDTMLGFVSENLLSQQTSTYCGAGTYSYAYNNNGNKYISDVATAYGDSFTSGDIIGCAVDLDNNYIYFSKNGTWQNSGDPTSGASGTGALSSIQTGYTYFPSFSSRNNNNTTVNFGNGYFGTTAVSSAENPDDGIGIFEYAVPTGYKALCTKSINAQEYD